LPGLSLHAGYASERCRSRGAFLSPLRDDR
jgi:hypothetical protein